MSLQKTDKTSGGLVKIWILRLRNFKGLHFNTVSSRYNLGDVRAYLEEIYFTIDTGGYSVKERYPGYEIKINAVIPGTDITIDAYLRELQNDPFLIVALNSNKQYLFFGDHDNFFTWFHDQDIGKDPAERSQYNFDVSANMFSPPRFIDNPFVVFSPSVSNVFISGLIKENETVTGMYTYNDPMNIIERNSAYRFYISDDDQGTNVQIASQLREFTIPAGNAGKYIRFSVVAKNAVGLASSETFSAYYEIAAAEVPPADPPIVSNVHIEGNIIVDESVIGRYTYTDPGGIPEAPNPDTRYYISDDQYGQNKQLVHSCNDCYYSIPASYEGKYLQYSVITKNTDGIYADEAFSPYYHIEAVEQQQPPTATNVQLTGNIETYGTAGISYDYSDPEGVPEESAILKFYISDDVEMTNIQLVATASTFEIPYAYAEKFLIPSVQVTNTDGLQSDEIFGDPVQIVRITLPPEISNVAIVGETIVGETIEGHYDYYDPNDLPEDGSTRQFWIAEDSSGADATVEAYGDSFYLDDVYLDKYVAFSVVGRNSEGVEAAEEFTDWLLIEVP